MKTLFVLLLIFSGETTKKLSKTPLKENAVKLTHLFTIDGGEDGFYDSISSSVNEDGKILILDRGNILAYIYDENGNEISSFGKEGSGPGEFVKWVNPLELNNRFAVFGLWNKIQLFKHDGTFVGEIKENAFRAKLKFKENELVLNFTESTQRNKPPEFLSKTYKYTGQLVSSKKNPDFKKEENEERDNNINSMIDNMEKRYIRPRGKRKFSGGEIQYYQGPYKLEFLTDINKTIITRPYSRIIEEETKPSIIFGGDSKEIKALNEKVKKKERLLSGGMKSDIAGFLGNTEDYLFVETSSESDKTIICDVISKDLDYYTKFQLDENDEIIYSYIKKQKLYIQLKSDDIGPYMKVYKLEIN